MSTHLVIGDVQAKDGVDFTYLNLLGRYIVEKKPDVVVCIGDFADMPSLSSYDVGKKCFEGRRYRTDIEAAYRAMETLLEPLKSYNEYAKKNHKTRYNPQLHFMLGNHEDRITRAVNDDPKLDGTIGLGDLKYEEFGWTVHPFLQVILIDGVAYSHYFTSGVMGRPIQAASALLSKKHMSCVAGHQQGRQIATAFRGDGKQITGIIAGSTYEHNEDYMGPQGNKHWRGFTMLHEVHDGTFDEMFVSLNFLHKKYETT